MNSIINAKIVKTKNDYYLKYLGEVLSVEELSVRTVDFILSENNVYFTEVPYFNDSNAGFLSKYNLISKELIKRYEVKNSPNAINLLSEYEIIFSTLETKEIFILNMKTGKITSFIKNNDFMNIFSIKIFKDRIYLVDTYAHKIFIYSISGLLEQIYDVSGKFEFPTDIELVNEKKIVINNNKIVTYKKFSTVEKMEKQNFYILKNDGSIEGVYSLLNKENRPPMSISYDVKGNIFILSDKYLYKFDSSLNLVFRQNLDLLIKEYKTDITDNDTIYYKMKIYANKLYILERNAYKKIFSFEILKWK